MADRMRPVPFRELIRWMFRELKTSASLFGISVNQIYRKQDKRSIHFCSQRCDTPVGPAAGPHTQLSQNIISSYLAGGRIMELKTVQQLDELKLDKPCIYASDEGYNVEWSSEHALDVSFDEYLKAWFILHLLESYFQSTPSPSPAFIFNMSIGYDLKGIKTEKMQKFINSMADASSHPLFAAYQSELEDLLKDRSIFTSEQAERLKDLPGNISPKVSPTVTLSTMHGCPPEEIEAICRYLLTEKQLDTYVKLNPTLLGFDRVREILDELGYDYIHISRESFERDLQFSQAVPMLQRLVSLAQSEQRCFGVKLSNTLGCINDQGQLPGDDDMYLSGRALFPLTVNLASLIADAFEGTLPISYCGGASAHNIARLFNCGIRPITSATDLLKPPGYLRLTDMAEACDAAEEGWVRETIDTQALKTLAEESVTQEEYCKEYRWESGTAVTGRLPVTDCYAAPCVASCPILQDVPEYLYLTGQGLYEEALELIYQKNPLPRITGAICDHQCMHSCNRMYFEGAVAIREVKRIAAQYARLDEPEQGDIKVPRLPKTAVVGGGPAGLSAAYFLAKAGFEVTVFEREKTAGGVVRHVIPGFRLPLEAIEGDVAAIEQLGVRFVFQADSAMLSTDQLKSQGYAYILYAIGAEKQIPLPLPAEGQLIYHSLDFLRSYREGRYEPLGEQVVVVGGGNTAMDSARAAAASNGVKNVTVLYRRTKREMPADLEEYENARKDGVVFRFLTVAEQFTDGVLVCREMELGEPDASGRPRPVKTERTYTIPCSSVISAIGEQPDWQQLSQWGVNVDAQGKVGTDQEAIETEIPGVYLIGDAASGPSTIVRCSASARAAVDAILEEVLGSSEDIDADDEPFDAEVDQQVPQNGEDAYFAELISKRRGWKPRMKAGEQGDEQLASYEASRCLECSYLCNMCIDVCPNRANIAVDVRSLHQFQDPFQIIHIDALCNECGNCAVFCPWKGSPYEDKFTLFSCREDFKQSKNPGMCLDGEQVHIRLNEQETVCRETEMSELPFDEPERQLFAQVLKTCREILQLPVNP